MGKNKKKQMNIKKYNFFGTDWGRNGVSVILI